MTPKSADNDNGCGSPELVAAIVDANSSALRTLVSSCMSPSSSLLSAT